MPNTLAQEVLKAAFQFGKVDVKAGIVRVEFPSGEVWDFTLPIKKYRIRKS